METEQLIQLIQAVSASELTQFKYEEKGVKLSLRKGEKGLDTMSVQRQKAIWKVRSVSLEMQLPGRK